MNMQTGPAKGQRMDSWLVWTGVVEIVNIPIFSLLALLLVAGRPGPWYLTAIGVLTLDVLLLEGGLYWLGKRWRIGSGLGPRIRLRLLRLLYVGNALLLLTFPLVAIISIRGQVPPGAFDLLLGLAYYLFAFGEFIHYFLFKINMRPGERRLAREKGHRVPARFRRELARATSSLRKAAG